MDETKEVVKEAAVTGPAVSEDTKTQEQKTEVVDNTAKPAIQAGDKTDPNLLLESLKKEREKRRLLEEELKTLKSSTSSEDEIFSDEGRALKNQISTLEARVASAEEEKNLEKLYNQFPGLREKAEEFNTFRTAEHPNAKLESVAKLYLVENGLLDTPRKGLEKPTGGQRTSSISGMTNDDVKTLRTTNFKKYQEMLMKGQLKID